MQLPSISLVWFSLCSFTHFHLSVQKFYSKLRLSFSSSQCCNNSQFASLWKISSWSQILKFFTNSKIGSSSPPNGHLIDSVNYCWFESYRKIKHISEASIQSECQVSSLIYNKTQAFTTNILCHLMCTHIHTRFYMYLILFSMSSWIPGAYIFILCFFLPFDVWLFGCGCVFYSS